MRFPTAAACIAVGTIALGATARADAPTPPLFDIPRLEKIAIDGDAADWGDAGFRVNALADNSARPRTADDFDATLRLAWNDRGLLVLVNVTDDVASENDNPDTLWRDDSVELFLKSRLGSKDIWQVVVAPGISAEHPDIRHKVYDTNRGEALKDVKAQPQLARKKVPGGYVLEALLPWENVGAKPATGEEVAFRIFVNDADEARTSVRAMWYPIAGSASDRSAFQRLRLSDHASTPVSAAACAFVERLRRTRVNVMADATLVDKSVDVRDGDRVLATGVLKAQSARGGAGRAAASLTFPLPALGSEYGPLTITADGKPFAVATLPKLENERQQLIDDADFVFHPSVFSAKKFPTGDLDDSAAIEDALGPYEVKTTFYNADFEPVKSAEKPGRYGAVVEITLADGRVIKRRTTLYRQPAELDWWETKLTATMEFPPQLGIDPVVAREQTKSIADLLKSTVHDAINHDDAVAVTLSALAETKAGSPAFTQRESPWSVDARWWLALRKKIGDPLVYKYLAHTPADYDKQPGKKYPLIMFLHGSEERTVQLEDVRNNLDQIVKGAGEREFIVVAPQCPPREWWQAQPVNEAIDDVCAKYRVDPDRIYLTGLSMGGFGAWATAAATPDRFAAVVPISGFGDPDDAARLLNLPTWAFHGTDDPTVPYTPDLAMYRELMTLGARARFTSYPGAGHNVWDTTYANPALYDWMLEQVRGKPKQGPATEPTTAPIDR